MSTSENSIDRVTPAAAGGKNQDESEENTPEQQLFKALDEKNSNLAKRIIKQNPKINLNSLDKDNLSPLHRGCHSGDIDLVASFLDHGADINLKGAYGYTPLMMAALAVKADIVQLLLERGADTEIQNEVNRTATDMASFVGLYNISAIILQWLPFESTVGPYTRCRELEDKPRIENIEQAKLLHQFITYPNQHPIKLLLFIHDHISMINYANNHIYVLENLASKVFRAPENNETKSLKFFLLSQYLLRTQKYIQAHVDLKNDQQDFKSQQRVCKKFIRSLLPEPKTEVSLSQPQRIDGFDKFILSILYNYPYTESTFSQNMSMLMKLNSSVIDILNKLLGGHFSAFFSQREYCNVCLYGYRTKKCGRCKEVRYCDSSCQEIDWFKHKKVCKNPEEKPLLTKQKDPNIDELYDESAGLNLL